MSDLVPFDMSGRAQRAVARSDEKIYSQVHAAGRRAEGLMAFTGHVMNLAVDLDEYRRGLAERCGPEMQQVLLRFESNAFHGLEAEQKRLSSGWF